MLKKKKIKVETIEEIVASGTKSQRFVLVGTYKKKPDQLAWIRKRHVYNYPLSAEEAKPGNEGWSKVKELWLYSGAKDRRHIYESKFIGIKPRQEFLADYPDYPTGGSHSRATAHGDFYAVFSVKHKYQPTIEDSMVTVRVKDFAKRTPKIAKAILAYQAGGELGSLLDYLPATLATLKHNQLRVCEAAVQMSFLPQMLIPDNLLSRAATVQRPIGIDLFAGCGGLSLGFEQAGFDIVAAVEIDPIHAAVHEYNFPYSKTICADIKNVDGADIRRLANIDDRDVDVVFGGAPCQGFSMIGKRALDDPRNQLISHYLRIVRDIRPKYCVLENVKGLTVGRHAQFLEELIAELRAIRYKVLLPYRVLNAADYGVPQNRERLFLIAAREDQALPSYPKPSNVRITVQDAISDIPDADQFESLLSDDSVAVKWRTERGYARQLRGLIPDETNFGYEREFDSDRLTSSMRTIHGAVSQERFLAAQQGETEPHSRFFKLAWGGQSNTLRAGTDSARGGFTSPRPIHPELPRVITVREAARIHSYPDWFRFHKTKWHGFREIGNSVPPRLARAVGGAIMSALGVRPSRPACAIKTGDQSLLGFDMRSAADYFGVSRNVIAQRKRKKDGK